MNKSDLPAILLRELIFQSARSGGPGGQHVNKVETKVELRWDVEQSESLTTRQRELIRRSKEFRNKINNQGILVLVHDAHRSQNRNKEELIDKFNRLLLAALTPKPKRKPTKVSKAKKEDRLKKKRENAQKKLLRKNVDTDK